MIDPLWGFSNMPASMNILKKFCVAAILLLGICKVCSAADRVIRADYTDIAGPLDHRFNFCVGSDRAAIHLRDDDMKQLKFVHDACGFRYVRFHGLLSEEMHVYTETPDGQPVYNWKNIDTIYDGFLAMGVKPFVELGFMPVALASGKETVFWYKSNITPPKSFEKWGTFIQALVQHWTERYGEKEVKSWLFEVWNEPNIKLFWTGTEADYFHLYDVTAHAIKAVNPAYRVGGPAGANNQWVPTFIAHCHDNQIPLDFISDHHYGCYNGYIDPDGTKKLVLDWKPNAIVGGVKQTKKMITDSVMPSLPYYVTEWSTSYTPRDPTHDSYFSAAYILEKLKQVGSSADCMSYWTYSDIFQEAWPIPSPFHGGFGLLNFQGLRKPAFFAYEFLNRLGSTQLNCTDTRSWVCKDDNGVQILFWNFSTLKEEGPNQVFFKKYLPAKPAGTATIQLGNLPPGDYTCKITRVGYRSNDVYDAFLDLHSPSDPKHHELLPPDALAYLTKASSGDPYLIQSIHVGDDKKSSLKLNVKENDVFFLTISK
jgi:xylan 1,4-beta-xylosidase